MNKTSWIIFTVFTAGILALLIFTSGSSRLDVSKVDTNAIQVANIQNGKIADHVSGKVGSKVILVEYGDFQCPPCASIYPKIKAISEQYKDQIQVVFRNFPIATSHPNAKAAAATAEAAGLQGKYWEMHDKIYEQQSSWSELPGTERNVFFEGLAKEIGLDITKFNNDVARVSITDKINYDYAIGKKAGVQGTPSFYLNGVQLESTIFGDDAKLKAAIDSELKKANIALPVIN